MSRKRKIRKKTPQPPYYWLLDSDDCWNCNCNHNGCRGCKRLKEQRAYERDKRKRQEKMNLRKIDF